MLYLCFIDLDLAMTLGGRYKDSPLHRQETEAKAQGHLWRGGKKGESPAGRPSRGSQGVGGKAGQPGPGRRPRLPGAGPDPG